ncbi:MAG: hypothetical protein CM15mV87_290 [Caudoviricetes sp.]|nr:MAG: hypothetical protein CM15mV87_290 [Caudoviricetes sp.]
MWGCTVTVLTQSYIYCPQINLLLHTIHFISEFYEEDTCNFRLSFPFAHPDWHGYLTKLKSK